MRPGLSSALASVLLLVASAQVAEAQRGPGRVPPQRREMLERELRERTGEIVRRRLELTDAQMTRLQASNRQFEQQRMQLFARERGTRQALRREMQAEDKANQSRIAELLDQTLLIERQRLDLLQSEQRELARFLTPVQRAKLLGLQTELRRRAQEMRRP